MTEELKPCPFCGGEAKLGDQARVEHFIVECGKCSKFLESINQDEVIRKWNQRTPEPNTSVLRWTRYDGTTETLPEEDKAISVKGIPAYRLENCFMFAVNLSVGGWQFIGRKIEIGDMWAYLQTPEGM